MSFKRSTTLLFRSSMGIVVVFALLRIAVIHAQTLTADETGIRAIMQSQQNAWNKGDAKAFAAHAAEDCLFTNIIGAPFVGRQSFEERHAKIFSTIYAGSHLAIRIRTLKFVTPDVAIVEAELALNGYKSLPPGIRADSDGILYTELEEVFTNRPGGWQMVSFHNVRRELGTAVSMECKLDDYKGTYGFTATGTVRESGAFAMVGRFTADGQGNIKGTQTRNFSGQVVHETYTETYTVNQDCAGSSQKKTSTGVNAQFDFVILNHGRTTEAVQTNPGDVVTLRAERLD
jgi:uncharacterized protein (TIGR02246 family)